MPKVEDQIFEIFNKLQESPKTNINKAGRGGGEINEVTVREIIKEQFNEALEKQIVPKLEEVLKGMLSQVKTPIA